MLNHEWKTLFLIIVVFIAACIETDIYLPAFIDMMHFFSVSEGEIQSLLTWNFTAICISGPLYGPLSDVFGRKKPLMVALGLFLAGSIVTLFADSFDWMLIGRVLQGLGSGGCFTLGTAIIFDSFQKEKAIQALNKINSIVPFIMAAAPMLGGYLNQMYGFRSNFSAITICVLASFIICLLFFDEPLPQGKRVPLNLKQIGQDFKKVSCSIPFWQTTFIVSLLFSGYLAFLSGISILFVAEFGVSKSHLPFYQAAVLGAWIVANFLFKHLVDGWGLIKIKTVGTTVFLIAGLCFALSAWMAPQNPYFVTGAMMLYALGTNWVQGIYFPEGMDLFPDLKGITASLLTSGRLLISAFVVGLAGSLYNSTIYPLAALICTLLMIVFGLILLYEKTHRSKERTLSQDHVFDVL